MRTSSFAYITLVNYFTCTAATCVSNELTFENGRKPFPTTALLPRTLTRPISMSKGTKLYENTTKARSETLKGNSVSTPIPAQRLRGTNDFGAIRVKRPTSLGANSNSCATGRLNRRGNCLSTSSVNENEILPTRRSGAGSKDRGEKTSTIPDARLTLARPPNVQVGSRQSSSESSSIFVPSPRSIDNHGMYCEECVYHASPPGDSGWAPSARSYPAQVHINAKGPQWIKTNFANGFYQEHDIPAGKSMRIVVADRKKLRVTANNMAPSFGDAAKGVVAKHKIEAIGGAIGLHNMMRSSTTANYGTLLPVKDDLSNANQNPRVAASTGGTAPKRSLRFDRATLGSLPNVPTVGPEFRTLAVSSAASASELGRQTQFGPAAMVIDGEGPQTNFVDVDACAHRRSDSVLWPFAGLPPERNLEARS